MKLSKRKSGFTLIELLIAIAILGIVLAAIFGFNIFGIKTYAIGEAQWNIQSDSRFISDLITRQARYALEVELTNRVPAANDGYDYIRTEGSSIKYYRNGSLVSAFPSAASTGRKMGIDFTGSAGRVLSFKITGIDDNNGRNYSIASKVICMNIPEDSEIKITSGSGSIRYKTNYSIMDIYAVPGDRRVDLVFTKPAGATSVKLYMSDVSASDISQYVDAGLNSDSTSAAVTGLTNGKQYWFKLKITGGDFDGESNTVTAVPFKPEGLTAQEVADAITGISSPPVNAASLTLPTVPEGFEIGIKYTSNSSVIDLNGDITASGTDTTVDIMLTVKKISDGTTADTAAIPVLVKAADTGTSNVGIKVSVKQLVNTTTGMEYRVSGDSWKACQNTSTSINIIETGCVIEVRKIGDTQTANWKRFDLVQPDAPAVSFTLQKGNKGIFNYDMPLEKLLEYSTNQSGGNWLGVSRDSIKTNNVSAVLVRKKATDSELPSKIIRVY